MANSILHDPITVPAVRYGSTPAEDGGCVSVVVGGALDSGLPLCSFYPNRSPHSGSRCLMSVLCSWFTVGLPAADELPVTVPTPGRFGFVPALLFRAASCPFPTPHLMIRTTSSRLPARVFRHRGAPSASAGAITPGRAMPSVDRSPACRPLKLYRLSKEAPVLGAAISAHVGFLRPGSVPPPRKAVPVP